MAESPSSALPGGVEWLPALGGARLLRVESGAGDPPALILHAPGGAEHRIEPGPEARFSRHLEYLVPAELSWNRASLAWPDGTRVRLPVPAGTGELIELHARRTPSGAVRGIPPVAPPRGWSAAPVSGGGRPPRLVAASEAAAKPWTAPPEVAAVQGAAEAEWLARRGELERELSRAAEALSRARSGERAARDSVHAALDAVRADLRAARAAREADASALATLTAELDAERNAHAVTRGTALTLAEALAASRAEVAAARAELEAVRAGELAPRAAEPVPLEERAREQAQAAAAAARRPPEQTGRLLADLAAAAATLRATIPEPGEHPGSRGASEAGESRASVVGVPERPTGEPRAPAPAVGLPERLAGEPRAPALAAGLTERPTGAPVAPAAAGETQALVAGLTERPTGAPHAPAAPAGLTERPTGEPVAPAAADAAARAPAASRAVRPAPPPPSGAGPVARGGAWLMPTVVGSPAAGWSAGSRPVALAVRDPRRLRHGLVALAREDGVTAAALLAALLPAQGAALAEDVSYDLTVHGLGTFAVTREGGDVEVRRIARRRSRSEARFHLAGDPLALTQVLAGERRRVGRFRGSLHASRRRRALRALRPLVDTNLSLADAAKAGARLEPALVYRALTHVIDPAWTRGHVFTVAQEIIELAPRAWYITARDGVPLTVAEHAAGAPADATVTMTRATFERLLRGEPALELPVIRGDLAAVDALRRWVDLARLGAR